jgi:hypothetical protein
MYMQCILYLYVFHHHSCLSAAVLKLIRTRTSTKTHLLPNFVLCLSGANDFFEFIKFLIFGSIVCDLSLVEGYESASSASASKVVERDNKAKAADRVY